MNDCELLRTEEERKYDAQWLEDIYKGDVTVSDATKWREEGVRIGHA